MVLLPTRGTPLPKTKLANPKTVVRCYSLFDRFFPACGLLDYTEGMYHGDPDMPYEAKRRGASAFDRLYRYDDYEHLARIREWLTQEAQEEQQ